MRDWLVGGALIETTDGLLLVQNRRRDGSHDWSTPGGVIEEGEELLKGLAREVEEETGLVVTEWIGPVYEVRIVAPQMGWRLRVEAHRAVAFSWRAHPRRPRRHRRRCAVGRRARARGASQRVHALGA